MKHVVAFSHELLQETLTEGDTAIDATCGNGNDTLALSTVVGKNGLVLSFDIQEQAIESTRNKITANQITNTRIIQDSHAEIGQYLEETEQIGGAIFNLGYLPGSDKTIITSGTTTVQAVQTILTYLRKQGVIILVIYHGHTGGKRSNSALRYIA